MNDKKVNSNDIHQKDPLSTGVMRKDCVEKCHEQHTMESFNSKGT